MRNKKVRRVIEDYIDYKDSKNFKNLLTDQGKIIPRRITGLSAKQHRELVRAIKRARQIAIMPLFPKPLSNKEFNDESYFKKKL
jgi:small subunit ribosomal protein S18